ncbi:hypothetical protein FPV67DRAFT_1456806 [Lyophyllum atratum]|nr:hypothetical protein FPV67DRAFT_1456806 [Lyophyllum atratum]
MSTSAAIPTSHSVLRALRNLKEEYDEFLSDQAVPVGTPTSARLVASFCNNMDTWRLRDRLATDAEWEDEEKVVIEMAARIREKKKAYVGSERLIEWADEYIERARAAEEARKAQEERQAEEAGKAEEACRDGKEGGGKEGRGGSAGVREDGYSVLRSGRVRFSAIVWLNRDRDRSLAQEKTSNRQPDQHQPVGVGRASVSTRSRPVATRPGRSRLWPGRDRLKPPLILHRASPT